MYAIVDIAGKQFKVEKDQKLYVHRLTEDEGMSVSFDNVMLVDDSGKVNVGTPSIKGASVNAKVLQHLKGDKVIVFKKKRRKGFKKKNGHRQYLSEIQIESIATTGGIKSEKKEVAPKKEAAPKAEVKEEATIDYSSMTVAELKEAAKEQGISGFTSLKKAELIEALTK